MVGVTSRNVLMDALRDFMGISERGRFLKFSEGTLFIKLGGSILMVGKEMRLISPGIYHLGKNLGSSSSLKM